MANTDIETLENSSVPFNSIPHIFSQTFPHISTYFPMGSHLSPACGALRSSISEAATAVAMALRQRRVTASGDFFGSKMALAQGEQLQTIPPKLRKNSVDK